MRLLVGAESDDSDDLTVLYAAPRSPWVRANMVSTVDGSTTGASGKSGSINNPADKRVFDTLRALADVIVVGAGTARTEGYRPGDTPIVVVSRSGEVPESLRDAAPGLVSMATVASAPGLQGARATLGDHHVIVAGETDVDHRLVLDALAEHGLTHVLTEGGPSLLGSMLAHGVVDELCCTVVPAVVGGGFPRIVTGALVDVPLRLHTLLEDGGTLLARWMVDGRDSV